ncbi:hypothetical protein Slu03_20270 [Sediminihabitans luteus]|nr:hypothetical protein Slu03_20270 [Sediminihabitans luteus]
MGGGTGVSADAGTVVVVGLGLVGGSVARALVAGGVTVLGVDPDAATRAAAREVGIDAVEDVPALAGRPLDVVVLAVPLRAMAATAAALAPVLGERTVLTDVGSVKGPVRAAIEAAGLGTRYVGAHPMAGTERSGFAASSAELVRGARWAVTADDRTAPDALHVVLGLVTGPLGGTASVLTDTAHDAAVALVSHVPHALATTLLTQVELAGVRDVALGLAAGSFRDGTRVGRTDPRRTEAMLVENAAHVAPVLRDVARDLLALADGLEAGAPVEKFFDAPATVRAILDARDVTGAGACGSTLVVEDAAGVLALLDAGTHGRVVVGTHGTAVVLGD